MFVIYFGHDFFDEKTITMTRMLEIQKGNVA